MAKFKVDDKVFFLAAGQDSCKVVEVEGFSDNGKGYRERTYKISRMLMYVYPDTFSTWSSLLHKTRHDVGACPGPECCEMETAGATGE